MFLKNLDLFAFRNHQQVSLAFTQRLQVFVGPNAQGKTNLAEAIYLLVTGRSFRRHTHARDMILHGAHEASVRGAIEREGLCADLTVRLGVAVSRRLFVNGHEAHLLREYVRHASVVAFQPEDLQMVKGGPDLRREFIDRAAFTLYPEYLDEYNRYYRALENRNLLLKKGVRGGELAAWTEELAVTGACLIELRLQFLSELLRLAQTTFAEIFGAHQVQLRYVTHPDLIRGKERIGERLRQLLEEREEDDRLRGFTGIGPHRDDIEMSLDGREARIHASQGQTRALALALRVAQVRHAEQVLGSTPLFILDDVASELDEQRRRFLTGFLQQSAVQAFVTTTDVSLLPTEGLDAEVWSVVPSKVVKRESS